MTTWADPLGLSVLVKLAIQGGSRAPTSVEHWIDVLTESFVLKFEHSPDDKDRANIESIAGSFFAAGAVISEDPNVRLMRGSMELGFQGRGC